MATKTVDRKPPPPAPKQPPPKPQPLKASTPPPPPPPPPPQDSKTKPLTQSKTPPAPAQQKVKDQAPAPSTPPKSESKSSEPKSSEQDSKTKPLTQSKTPPVSSEPKSSEAKSSEPKTSELESSEPKSSEPKTSELESSEPKSSQVMSSTASEPTPAEAETETDPTSMEPQVRNSRGRGELLKQTNADLKILDAEYKKIDGKIDAKRGDYLNANTELKNKLDVIKRGDAASWVSTADTLGKTLDETQNSKLNPDALVADRKRLETEYRDPIMKRIKDAGYDATEFLKESDVYKLTSNSTSARDLSAAVQALGSTASDLTTSLTTLWDDPATGISKDEGAIAAAGRLDTVLKNTSATSNNLAKTYHAAGSLGEVVEQAGGDSISTDPRWTTVRNDQKSFFDDVGNVYRAPGATPPGAPPPPVEGPPPPPTIGKPEEFAKLHAADFSELGAQQNTLATTFKTAAATLNGQDFERVKANTANVDDFADSVLAFKNELDFDAGQMVKTTEYVAGKNSRIEEIYKKLETDATAFGTSLKDVYKLDTPEIKAQLVYQDDVAKANLLLLDANAQYTDRIGTKAQQYLDGWDQVKKNAKTAKINEIVQGAFDWFSGTEIVATAAKKLTTAAQKIAQEGRRSVEFLDYSVNVGQVTDFVQIAVNQGWHGNTLTSMPVGTNSKNLYERVDEKMLQYYDKAFGQNGSINRLNAKVRDYTHDRFWKGDGDHTGAPRDLWIRKKAEARQRLELSASERDVQRLARQLTEDDFDWYVNNSHWLTETEKHNLQSESYEFFKYYDLYDNSYNDGEYKFTTETEF